MTAGPPHTGELQVVLRAARQVEVHAHRIRGQWLRGRRGHQLQLAERHLGGDAAIGQRVVSRRCARVQSLRGMRVSVDDDLRNR
jgi:predicted component of type VI protein secretion system